jgi:putative DNA primase/helicase
MFYHRDRGIWRREDYAQEFKHTVQDLFIREAIPTPSGFTSHLINDVVNLTQAYISQPDWNDDDDMLAFSNGVLEISTGEFLDHDQENYLTWGLDFDYDPSADPGPIIDWLRRTQYNDEDRVQVLRAWLRACLLGQGHELQRFMEVIGPGGRGKSTFANLCCALVGSGNYASTTLNQLEQSRFEVASIKGKRLTLINDSERYGGSAQIFKALTGGDNLRFEEKNKNVGEPFVYTGMVMVCANEPIQTTDNTSGLTRRRLTLEFNRPLYDKNSEAKEMIKLDNGIVRGLWKNYLPGLVNWVLQMTDKEMREYLLDTYDKVPSLRRVRNEILLNSNNLIEWLQSEVVHAPDHTSSVGKKIPAAKDAPERYNNSNHHLYASYCSYAEDTGSKPVGQKRFIALLLDCCVNQLGLKDVRQFSKQGRPFIKGLAIRAGDTKFQDYPTILPEGMKDL